MTIFIAILLVTLAISALLNVFLSDALQKSGERVEELWEENEELRQQLDDLRRQNDFLMGRM